MQEGEEGEGEEEEGEEEEGKKGSEKKSLESKEDGQLTTLNQVLMLLSLLKNHLPIILKQHTSLHLLR